MEKWVSQDGQDKFLVDNFFHGYKDGFFVDVGAHDGKTINNTVYFENVLNWKGINIEPNINVYKSLILNRPKCINLNCAVSNKDGVSEFILNTGYTEMISGLKENYHPLHYRRLENEIKTKGGESSVMNVVTKKLATIFETYNIDHVNYLSIDVEGAEFEVIKSIDFDKVFIDIIGFENNYNDSTMPIINYLIQKDYLLIESCANQLDIFMIHKDSQFKK